MLTGRRPGAGDRRSPVAASPTGTPIPATASPPAATSTLRRSTRPEPCTPTPLPPAHHPTTPPLPSILRLWPPAWADRPFRRGTKCKINGWDAVAFVLWRWGGFGNILRVAYRSWSSFTLPGAVGPSRRCHALRPPRAGPSYAAAGRPRRRRGGGRRQRTGAAGRRAGRAGRGPRLDHRLRRMGRPPAVGPAVDQRDPDQQDHRAPHGVSERHRLFRGARQAARP